VTGLGDTAPDPCIHHRFVGAGFVAGRFHCGPDSARWHEVNWIGEQPHVVVPDTAVRLLPDTGEPYVSTVNHVLVYDRDVHYRRQLLSADGDRCTFIALDEPLAGHLGVGGAKRPRLRHGPCGAGVFALHHHLRAALAEPEPDRLRVDEITHTLLARAVAGVAEPPAGGRAARHQWAAVENVKAILAGDPLRVWSLADLSAQVHYSPFSLARLFRARTGYSICGYRQQLRLRASLPEALAGPADRSGVAARFGFSSHSHDTRVFRETFGCTPSRARRQRGWPPPR
jgi:AraC-like DNA-binding protein